MWNIRWNRALQLKHCKYQVFHCKNHASKVRTQGLHKLQPDQRQETGVHLRYSIVKGGTGGTSTLFAKQKRCETQIAKEADQTFHRFPQVPQRNFPQTIPQISAVSAAPTAVTDEVIDGAAKVWQQRSGELQLDKRTSSAAVKLCILYTYLTILYIL